MDVGTAVPSVALGSTLGVEMLLYHGFNDTELTVKALMIDSLGSVSKTSLFSESLVRCLSEHNLAVPLQIPLLR